MVEVTWEVDVLTYQNSVLLQLFDGAGVTDFVQQLLVLCQS